jgi:hypothetical protein
MPSFTCKCCFDKSFVCREVFNFFALADQGSWDSCHFNLIMIEPAKRRASGLAKVQPKRQRPCVAIVEADSTAIVYRLFLSLKRAQFLALKTTDSGACRADRKLL